MIRMPQKLARLALTVTVARVTACAGVDSAPGAMDRTTPIDPGTPALGLLH
jgi:hypothetical protein